VLRPAARASILVALAVLVPAAVLTASVLSDPQVVSLFDNGQAGNQDAHGAAVSADGRYVAFTSTAVLAGAATNGVLQLYVRDRVGGRTLLASAGATGQAADASVDDPATHRAYAISGDGRYVVFASTATNLAAGDADGSSRDVFRKDLVTGAVAIVSRAPGGAQADGSVGGDPDVSYDGSRVVYATGAATNLWFGDPSAASDIVMHDLTFGTSTLVSVAPGGVPATQVAQASISADGRHVAFEAGTSVLVRDMNGAATVTVPGAAAAPDLSGDGAAVAVESGAGGVDRHAPPGGPATPVAVPGSSPSISADGRRVAYEAPGTPAHIFAQTVGVGDERVSERPGGSASTLPSAQPAISANGAIVAFNHDDSGGTSLVAGDVNGRPDVVTAQLAPSDALGPRFVFAAFSADPNQGAPSTPVNGFVSDPSGVVAVSIGGIPAALSATGGFSLDVPLAVGINTIPIRATDGAGNVTETILTARRVVPPEPKPAVKARARALRVVRVGRITVVRFRLDPGARRVTTRLWRRVPRSGAPPGWTPVGAARVVARTPGARAALLSRTPLRADVYQVRVSVVSAGGVAVTVLRYRVLRPGNR
jgi:Tol biopolymer transport system component